MAIYHLNVKTGTRKGGQSAQAKYDYINREGKYSRDYAEVESVDDGHMPAWAQSKPRDYWQAADRGERANGRLYREVEFALPLELRRREQIALAKRFARSLTEQERLPYSLAIHRGESKEPGKRDNPHVHLMISERANDGRERSAATWFKRHNAKNPENGGARKSTATHPREWLEETREDWAIAANRALERSGSGERIHEGSLEQQYFEAVEGGDELEAERLQHRTPGQHHGISVRRQLARVEKLQEQLIDTDRMVHAAIRREVLGSSSVNDDERTLYLLVEEMTRPGPTRLRGTVLRSLERQVSMNADERVLVRIAGEELGRIMTRSRSRGMDLGR